MVKIIHFKTVTLTIFYLYYPLIGVKRTEKYNKYLKYAMWISGLLAVACALAAFGVYKYGDQGRADTTTTAAAA